MIIKDLFKKDIDRSIQPVVTIGNEDDLQKFQELDEYVCTDEIVKSFRTFFRKYRESIATPTEKMGVWITGFFGSGKSHFLKILGYILENEQVNDQDALSFFEEKVKDEIVLADMRQSAKCNNKVVLFNIDSKAKSDSKNKTQSIMDIMLRSFNEAVGYCGTSPWVADLERTLDSENQLEQFIESFESCSGREWKKTRSKALLNRDYIIKALVEVRGMSEESAKAFIEDQTQNFTSTTEEFAKIVNDYCKTNNTRVIFLIDEVGQFMGDNTQLMLNLQTCVEDLGKFCRGQAWVVVTSQQELKAMIDSTKDKQQDFSKIQGRFDTRLLLSGSNADEVIKKRILEKKDLAVTSLKSLYDGYGDKLDNLIMFQAKPTWSGYKDSEEFKDVYPFVSYQFELLQKVFEAIREHGMSEGKHLSQNERSLLSAFQESAREYSDKEAGVLVPFDSFYNTVEHFIDYDIKTVFANAEKRPSIDAFAIRVLRVLFMIKHVKEMPPTIDRMATLLVESVHQDKAELKNKILEALKVLESETLIQKNGEEYDFLTNAEQDVNKQINSANYNEGAVQRTISSIIYERILDNNKLRYENRYDFAINRFVDSESKGSFNADNITIRILTKYSGLKEDAEFAAESSRNNSIIVDLTEGTFIDELIKAEKIETFKRNNSATMSPQLTEIMSKKTAEYSERVKRAEDIIRQALREAPIYLNGQRLDIKTKDGKDRLVDALKEMVKQEFYKLGLVSYYFDDQKSISNVLGEKGSIKFADDHSDDPNSGAYEEIFEKVKTDKGLGRKITVKSLLDHFTKKPFGWREYDILGMIATLWQREQLQIAIHSNIVEESNFQFQNDFVRKNGIDTMTIRMQEKIDDQILYQVKRIMNDVYNENLELDEKKLKSGVTKFFEAKKSFLETIRAKYGSEFAGSSIVSALYKDFSAILASNDALKIFEEVIARRDSLEDNVEGMEQIESFYKDGSSQQQNFDEAIQIADWFHQHNLLEDLSSMTAVVEEIEEIIGMDIPFGKMSRLSTLVIDAAGIKERILEEKYNKIKTILEKDQSTVNNELVQALAANLTDEQKQKIQDKADSINAQYESWLGTLNKNTQNMDSYVTSSKSTIDGFRSFIAGVMAQGGSNPKRSKRLSVIDCIPVANKKIESKEDIDKVLAAIKEKLLYELEGNDEITLS